MDSVWFKASAIGLTLGLPACKLVRVWAADRWSPSFKNLTTLYFFLIELFIHHWHLTGLPASIVDLLLHVAQIWLPWMVMTNILHHSEKNYKTRFAFTKSAMLYKHAIIHGYGIYCMMITLQTGVDLIKARTISLDAFEDLPAHHPHTLYVALMIAFFVDARRTLTWAAILMTQPFLIALDRTFPTKYGSAIASQIPRFLPYWFY